MAILKGTDLSSYIVQVNWPQLITDGYGAFMYARACDGLYVDTRHSTHIGNATKYAVPAGSYQYGHPSHDVEQDVDAFLKIVTPTHVPENIRLRHVVDMETLVQMANGEKVIPANAGAWANDWCEIVKWRTKTEPIIYASAYYFIEMCKQVPTLGGPTGWDYWCADYTGTPTHPLHVGGLEIPVYVAHQFAGDVKLTNQVGLWDLDAVYNDNIDALRMSAAA